MHRLIGLNPSPYSVKMRAVLRYRRLPFVWDTHSDPRALARQHGLPPVIPVLVMPDGMVMNDSTQLIRVLEQRYPGVRSIMPPDAAQAFLAGLIEDMADEWLTKCMFHYRWYYAPDRAFARHWVIGDRSGGFGTDPATRDLAAATQAFEDRQVGRMPLVGCTEETKPVIEASYLRILSALDAGVRRQPFLFGGRPSLADFGLFGQLHILATDPTPATLMRAHAPHVFTWLMRLDDASGVEGDWLAAGGRPHPMVVELLRFTGEVYLPFLKANADGIEAGRETLSVSISGSTFRQPPFRYQAKCWRTLRADFAALDPAARGRIEPLLAETGCLAYLA
jgi:glutathione S-transferase